MKYLDLIEKNRILGSQLKSPKYEVHIISNIILNEIGNVLEYNLRVNNINANCTITNYDNILQNVETSKKSDCVIIFWELSNIFDDILYTQNSISDRNLKKIEERILNEIDYVFNSLKDTKLVIFNKFCLSQFNNRFYFETKIEKLCIILNNYIISKKIQNVNLIDLNKIFSLNGLENYINDRDFSSIKTLYKFDFFRDYINLITPLILNNNGRSKKVLIFDCDNTLWPGVLGEDGPEEINIKLKSINGKFFYFIQKIILDLYNNGIILCICSKNNEKDILDFIDKNPNLLINSKHFLIKKINWKNKHENIIEISTELNLPLDSFIFIDDSKFEINLIKNKIPEVTTFMVPINTYEYPRKLLEFIPFFYKDELTKEDIIRNKTYEQQIDRDKTKKNFSNIQDYLKSLNINISLFFDETEIINRMSQITQKTNQFNLTTQRYSELEIKNFLESKEYSLIAISVSDDFGNAGITGLSIIQYLEKKTAIIDSLILSCRILGRKIEYVFLDQIIKYLKEKKIEIVKSSYLKTLKNDQVLNYYDNNKFKLTSSCDTKKEYSLQIDKYIPNNIEYIKVNK